MRSVFSHAPGLLPSRFPVHLPRPPHPPPPWYVSHLPSFAHICVIALLHFLWTDSDVKRKRKNERRGRGVDRMCSLPLLSLFSLLFLALFSITPPLSSSSLSLPLSLCVSRFYSLSLTLYYDLSDLFLSRPFSPLFLSTLSALSHHPLCLE
jgi:hypothetical protein